MLLLKNNAFSFLAASISATDTLLAVRSGTGDSFPSVAAPDYFLVTLQNSANNIEIVRVVSRIAGSDVFTIVRAQEGTTARAWALGDIVENRLTAASAAPLSVLEGASSAAAIRSVSGSLRSPIGNGIVVQTGGDQTSSRSIAVSGIGLTVSNASGATGNPTIQINSTPANTPSTVVSRDAAGGFSAGLINGVAVQNLLQSYEITSIQPVNVANALQSDGSFPTTAQEEQAILFSGQNEDHLLPKVGPSLGFILFQPAQEVMTGYVHSRTDLARNTTLNRRAMPLVTLKSFCGNSPIDLKLFKADVVLDGTINRFKYTGAYPIHGILQGSITFLLRLGTDATAKAKLRLSLVYLNAPNITAGQTNRLDLGVSLASVQSTPEALLRSEFRDSDKSDLGALSGLWVRKHINVCQDVVFYPDTTYYFALSVLPEAGGVVDTNYGFRYESGGLSMVFDASANIKELAKNNLIA